METSKHEQYTPEGGLFQGTVGKFRRRGSHGDTELTSNLRFANTEGDALVTQFVLPLLY